MSTSDPGEATNLESPENVWRHSYNVQFTEHLYDLLSTEVFSDVKITVEGKAFHCHRLILSAHSEYFKTMFMSEFQESRDQCVELRNPVTCRLFEKLMKYMYKGENIITDKNATSVLKLADYLQMQHLVNESANILMNTVSEKNCFKVLKVANESHLAALKEAAIYVIVKEFQNLCKKSEGYSQILATEKDDFVNILKDECLNTFSEEDVCDLAISWLLNKFNERKDAFEEVVKVLRLPLVGSEFLLNFHQKYPSVSALPYMQTYLTEALTYQLVPTKRHTANTVRTMHRVRSDILDSLVIVGGYDEENADEDLLEGGSRQISKTMYFGALDAFLNEAPEYFSWRKLNSLHNYIKSSDVLLIVHGDSDLYVIGSSEEYSTPGYNYRYSGISGKGYKHTGPPITHRVDDCLAECVGDYIYMIGGTDFDDGTYVETVSRYHTKHDTWENVGCLVEPTNKFLSVSGVIDDKIYLFEKKGISYKTPSYFQCFDTSTDSCHINQLYDHDPDYVLGLPEASVSHDNAIYMLSYWYPYPRSVFIVKFTNTPEMKFERVGEEFHTQPLMSLCQMLLLDNSLYIFGGRSATVAAPDSQEEYENYPPRTVNEVTMFSLTDKRFTEYDKLLPESLSDFTIKRFTIRKDTIKKGRSTST